MSYVNHVAVPVENVDLAAAFYEEWFGARAIPSPRFPVPVAWVLLGKVQLHLVQRVGEASQHYHFGVGIESREQFEALYWRAEREGNFDRETFQHHIFETSSGVVQMYLQDPSGNLVDVAYPNVNDLAPAIVSCLKRWSDYSEQSAWNNSASLFMPEQAGLAADIVAPNTSR